MSLPEAPPVGGGKCQLPKCDKKLSDSNPTGYCWSHPPEKIAKHKATLKSKRKKDVVMPPELVPHPCPTLLPDRLVGFVCDEWNVDKDNIKVFHKGGKWTPSEAQAKRVAICLCRVDMGLGKRKIAKLFGFSNGSNVPSIAISARRDIANDPEIAAKVERIRARYQEEAPT